MKIIKEIEMMKKKKILTEEEWYNKNWNKICKFKHVYEDQDVCIECGISVSLLNKCYLKIEKFEKYKRKFTNYDDIYLMMTVQ